MPIIPDKCEDCDFCFDDYEWNQNNKCMALKSDYNITDTKKRLLNCPLEDVSYN